MAVYPTKKDSNRSPVSGSSKAKRIWEIKSKLVKKRLMDLSSINNDKINEGSVNVDKRIICYSPKEKSTNDLHSFDGLSSSSAMDRAQEIQEKLPLNSPSFLKNLLRSHVTQGFWLGLPRQFCVAHLPNHDETVMLVVENEKEEHSTKYLAEKNGLSAGWRGFSIAHKLVEGDVCVFQLIKPCKLKVHIVRASALTEEVVSTCALTEEVKDGSSLSEVNAARSLINLYAYPIEAGTLEPEVAAFLNASHVRTSAPTFIKGLIKGTEIGLEGRADQAQIQKHYKIPAVSDAVTCRIAARDTL